MTWYADYLDRYIGFVVETRHGKFKPLIATCFESHGDNDCIVYVTATQPPQETMEAALMLLDAEAHMLKRIFRKPQKSGGMMGHWLMPLFSSEGEKPWLN